MATASALDPAAPPPQTPVPLPRVTLLAAAEPNPVRASTTICYAVAYEARVQLSVYDLSGRCVRWLENEVRAAGDWSVTWDARDATGRRVVAGVYWVRFTADGVDRSLRLAVRD